LNYTRVILTAPSSDFFIIQRSLNFVNNNFMVFY